MNGQENLKLSNEELRTVLLETLKGSDGGQWEHLRTGVAATAIKMGLMDDPRAPKPGGYGVVSMFGNGEPRLTNHDFGRVLNIFWDLVIEGILRPGYADGMNSNLPFFHVTERGKAAIDGGHQSPYDPDG